MIHSQRMGVRWNPQENMIVIYYYFKSRVLLSFVSQCPVHPMGFFCAFVGMFTRYLESDAATLMFTGWCPEHAHLGHRAVWASDPSFKPPELMGSWGLATGFLMINQYEWDIMVHYGPGRSCDLRPQMNRTVLRFCTPTRLGIARVQKLAVLQSFDDKQMIATCEALLAADWQRLLLICISLYIYIDI